MNFTVKTLATALTELVQSPHIADITTAPENNPDAPIHQHFIHTNDESHPCYPLYQAVMEQTDEVLIFEGQPNYQHISELGKLGYKVGPGEQDSFGWVTGVIYTPVGLIVFG